MSEPLRILIVDDEPDIVSQTRALFTKQGWKAAGAPGGREAIALAEQHSFDVVLLDMRMPGMDGFRTMAELLSRRPDMCIVFFTAYGDVASASEAVRGGATLMITKGERFEVIHAQVRRAYELKRDAALALREKEEARQRELAAYRLTKNLAIGMAHQIKNALSPAYINLSLLADNPTPPEAKKVCVSVKEDLDHVQHALRLLLRLGRLQDEGIGDLDSVSLSETIDNARARAMRQAAKGNAVRINSRVSTDIEVRGQSDWLVEAFECLFSNALRIVGKHSSQGVIDVQVQKRGSEVAVVIQDNGPGFSDKQLGEGPRWFATSAPGINFGVGLPFADEVFRACGGSMRLGNRVDQAGAKIDIVLSSS